MKYRRFWMMICFLAATTCGWSAESEAAKVHPGVRGMAERLQRVVEAEDPMNNTFRNRERAEIKLEYLRNQTDPERIWEALRPVAEEQLKAGDPRGALASYDKFDQLSVTLNRSIDSRQRQALLHRRAICHLRIGEQQNCLTNHTIESCLFPVRSLGIYQRQEGPREAIKILTECLQTYRSDFEALWLLNVASMLLGEYPDKVPERWRLPPRLFESEHDIKQFRDVSSGAGLDIPGWAGGSVVDDFDGDGFLDVMISSWEVRSQFRYFRNNGDGTFSERTAEAGLTGLTGGLNMVQADYNNDGHVDVMILRGAWLAAAGKYPNSLLRNNGDGTFEDVTEEAGLLSFHPTQTAAWLDYNGDGWIDLFIGNESYGANVHPNELYRNNGNGTFTECAAESGVTNLAYVKGVVAGDFNNDGRLDLYVSSRSGPNFLFQNGGAVNPEKGPKSAWRFTNVAHAAEVDNQAMSFPTATFDYDNDGWLDIFVAGYAFEGVGDIVLDYFGKPFRSEAARLYRNNRDGTFRDVTKESRLYKVILAMGLNYGDFDNDGWLDLLAGTGDPDFATVIPNRAFRNAEGKFFQEVTTSGGLGHLQKGHAVVFADIDNDGDQDVFEVIGGAYTDDTYRCSLLENPGHGNHWLTLKLEGVKSNRSAHGARIKVVVKTDQGERAIYKTVSSGGSFGASPLRQEIGLGKARSIQSVEVFWPTTGQTQVMKNLDMDRFYKVREGENAAMSWNVRAFKLRPPDERLCAPPGTVLPARAALPPAVKGE